MGQTASLITEEKERWIDHDLKLDAKANAIYKEVLNGWEIGKPITLEIIDRKHGPLSYQHYRVVSNGIVCEFDGESIYQSQIKAHFDVKSKFKVIKTRPLTIQMCKRARAVLGARGYSLLLRNCEHTARYIYFGQWISTQTTGNGPIISYFTSSYNGLRARLNALPTPLSHFKSDLKEKSTYQSPFEVEEITYYVEKKSEAKNVVIMGPTGSGKSKLINRLLDMNAVESKASQRSVTKQLAVIKTKALIRNQRVDVNLIDTVGLCDSDLTVEQVEDLFKSHIQTKVLTIHHVLVLLHHRMSGPEAQSTRTMLEWLQSTKAPLKFTFILTRRNSITQEEFETLVSEIAADYTVSTIDYLDGSDTNYPILGFELHADDRMRPSEKRKLGKAMQDLANHINIGDPIQLAPQSQCIIL